MPKKTPKTKPKASSTKFKELACSLVTIAKSIKGVTSVDNKLVVKAS